jgi:lactate permease
MVSLGALMCIGGIWGIPAFKSWVLNTHHWFVAIPHWPFLDGVVYRAAPIVSTPAKYAASYRWEYFTAAGTAMLISSFVSMVILKISPERGLKVFGKTCKQLVFALDDRRHCRERSAGVMRKGQSQGKGHAGVVRQERNANHRRQRDDNPVLTTSANLFGGVMGKLISPQSIAVACAATGLIGRETDIFRKTLRYSVMLLAVTIVVVWMQAYVVPGIVPQDIVAAVQP